MKKRIKVLVIIIIIVVVLAISGIFIWKWKKSANNSSEKTNNEPKQVEKCFKCSKDCGSSPIKKDKKTYCSQKCADNNNGNGGDNNDNKNDGNKKKDLVEKIKTDLKERIERVKNGSRVLEDIMPYVIQGKSALCNVENLNFIKDGEEISSDSIGEENFQSIVNLFKQIRTAKEEWEEKKWREAREKADTNPNLFYFPARGSFVGGILTDEITHYQFYSRQDKKDYRLTIPKLHPDLAGLSIKSDDWNLYRITGVENIPLVPCPIESVKVPYKIVKLEDKITIKIIEN